MNIPEKHKSKNKKFTKAKITKASETLRKIAKIAGVNINGKEPYDITVNNDDFYTRALSEQSIGLGESYMDQSWDCKQIDELINKIMQSNIEDKLKKDWNLMAQVLMHKVFNQQIPNSRKRAL